MSNTTSTPTIAPGRAIEVNGASLYYEEYGQGAPLLLIHGGLVATPMWGALLPHLTDHFRVIAFDSRGHGRSTNPHGALSYPLLADDAAALIAELGLEQPLVGGWSDGGQVAIEFGARHPGVAGGLLIGAAYPDYRATGFVDFWRQLAGVDATGTPDLARVEAGMGDFVHVVKAWHTGGEAQWQALVHQTTQMYLAYEGLTPDDLGRIGTPALVLTGDRDEAFGIELSVKLYRALPRAELAVCPGADHFAPLGPDRAGIFASMIRDYARRNLQTN
jgi:pimeloyl-ACP methyl ester carboxylesterase